MFWRFVSAGSSFESLLSRSDPPPSLDELLDEDDLLTECKTQNPKLIEFLGRPESIRGLMGWVVKNLEEPDPQSDSEEERRRRQRFPQLATEVLCSEIWAIVETALSPDEPDLLKDFWEVVLGPIPSSEEKPEDPEVAPLEEPSASEITVTLPDVEVENDVTATATESAEQKYQLEKIAIWEADKKEVVYGNWSRVNAMFVSKKTVEMLAFIRAQPFILERLLAKISSPAIVELLFRLMQCEDSSAGQGVIDWFSSESLIPRLTALLSPSNTCRMHDTICDLLKGIVVMAAPASGPFNPNATNATNGDAGTEGGFGGMRNNRLARELVAEDTVERLVGFMLDHDSVLTENGRAEAKEDDIFALDEYETSATATAVSSLTSSISVFIEIIRKNNSDYSEPHLFHTLRNRLMNLQRTPNPSSPSSPKQFASDLESQEEELVVEKTALEREEESRRAMEDALVAMTSRMGIVHLGNLLTVLSARLGHFQQLLKSPRSDTTLVVTGYGPMEPLTLERFRIVELYAELLHCSNMAILNRPAGGGPSYDDDGHLLGGLSGLEELARALSQGNGEDDDPSAEDHLQEAKELPVSVASTSSSRSHSPDQDEDDDNQDDDDDEDQIGMEDVSVTGDATPVVATSTPTQLHAELPRNAEDPESASSIPQNPPLPLSSPLSPSEEDLTPMTSLAETPLELTSTASETASVSRVAVHANTHAPSISSEIPNIKEPSTPTLSPGDLLKSKFIEHGLLTTLLDLTFDFPLNNFLHNVVYDVLQQILTGSLESGFNRNLVLSLFQDTKIVDKILHGQKLNDAASSGGRSNRLGFMGHLVLIAEDIVKFFQRCPAELLSTIKETFIESEWNSFVEGAYNESKVKDNSVLGGGKPRTTTMSSVAGGSNKSDSEEEDDDDDGDLPSHSSALGHTTFSRGFGFSSSGEEGESTGQDQFSRYLVQQMTSGGSDRQFESSSDDDDDDDADWIGDNSFDSSDSFGSRREMSVSTNSAPSQGGSRVPMSFEASFSPVTGFDDDDAWGSFQGGGDTPPAEDNRDPFGDDFAPSTSSNDDALQALDWNDATEFQDFDDDDDPDAWKPGNEIKIPDMSEGDEEEDQPTTPTGKKSPWSFGIPGTDLPTSDFPPKSSSADKELSEKAEVLSLGMITPASPIPHLASKIFTPMDAISPPDASLLETVSDKSPLGPGVPDDVISTEVGLSRIVDGVEITVPKDEITLAVELENSTSK